MINHSSLKTVFYVCAILSTNVVYGNVNKDYEGKERLIVIRPSFLLTYVDMVCKGPGIEFGYKTNRSQYTLSLEWYNSQYSDKPVLGETAGGGGFGLHWLYDICTSNLYHLSPGITMGIRVYTTEMVESKTYRFFGGPEINGEIGYKYFFLFADNTLLLGNSLMNIFKMGISVYF